MTIQNSIKTGSKISSLLEEAEFGKLSNESSPEEIGNALQKLAHSLKWADNLKRQLVRGEAIKCLKKLDVKAPARLVDAAFESKKAKDNAPEYKPIVTETEPWEKPVDGAALLDELAAIFARFLVLPDGAAET